MESNLIEAATGFLNRGNLNESKSNELSILAENLLSGANNISPNDLKKSEVVKFKSKLKELNVWMNSNLVDSGIIK